MLLAATKRLSAHLGVTVGELQGGPQGGVTRVTWLKVVFSRHLLRHCICSQSHQCGMGYSSLSHDGIGSVAPVGLPDAHQCPGDKSSPPSSPSFAQAMRSLGVVLVSDNSVVVNKDGDPRLLQLFPQAREVLEWAVLSDVSLVDWYIPGERSVVADQLSRRGQVLSSEGTLHPLVVETVFMSWGQLMVVLFATSLNRQLDVYVSPLPDPKAWSVDVFLTLGSLGSVRVPTLSVDSKGAELAEGQ